MENLKFYLPIFHLSKIYNKIKILRVKDRICLSFTQTYLSPLIPGGPKFKPFKISLKIDIS